MGRGKTLTQTDIDMIKQFDDINAQGMFKTVDDYCAGLARMLGRPKLSQDSLRDVRARGYRVKEKEKAAPKQVQQQILMATQDNIDEIVSAAVAKVLAERGIL